MKTVETIEFVIKGGRRPDYNGCSDCRFADIPEDACRIMKCIHAFGDMYDVYEKGQRNDK